MSGDIPHTHARVQINIFTNVQNFISNIYKLFSSLIKISLKEPPLAHHHKLSPFRNQNQYTFSVTSTRVFTRLQIRFTWPEVTTAISSPSAYNYPQDVTITHITVIS